jgi:hypothetical protein
VLGLQAGTTTHILFFLKIIILEKEKNICNLLDKLYVLLALTMLTVIYNLLLLLCLEVWILLKEFSFFGSIGIWTQGFTLARQMILPLELLCQPCFVVGFFVLFFFCCCSFFFFFFWYRVLKTICLGLASDCYPDVRLLSSWITGVSHQHSAVKECLALFKKVVIIFYFSSYFWLQKKQLLIIENYEY